MVESCTGWSWISRRISAPDSRRSTAGDVHLSKPGAVASTKTSVEPGSNTRYSGDTDSEIHLSIAALRINLKLASTGVPVAEFVTEPVSAPARGPSCIRTFEV